MLVTEKFITDFAVCQETAAVIRQNNLLDLEVPEVLRALRDLGMVEPTAWWNNIDKSTEVYVRHNGSIFTMGAYQVFNPLTGVHIRYETEAEAKQGLIAISQAILEQHKPTVVQELSNENGDTTWIPTEIGKTLIVS